MRRILESHKTELDRAIRMDGGSHFVFGTEYFDLTIQHLTPLLSEYAL